MKNFQKLVLGLMVGDIDIGFSAFTNAHSIGFVRPNKAVKAGMITDNYLVQSSLNVFDQSATAPVPADCSGTATRYCAYSVTSSGKSNIPNQSSYTGSEIDTYVTNGWLTSDSSSKAIYQP